jgi:hypothetical protein
MAYLISRLLFALTQLIYITYGLRQKVDSCAEYSNHPVLRNIDPNAT